LIKDNLEVFIDEKSTFEVPKWQQEIIFERIKNSKTEDYQPLEEVLKELDKKWLYKKTLKLN
jgi:hypothetical protein